MHEPLISIAIAEDHNLVRNAITDLLNSFERCSVVAEAPNGQELIDQIKLLEKKPDITILDISMPILNGYDTLVALKKLYPSMKFLILTMFEKEYNIIRMIKSGANGYLYKGCSNGELKEAIFYICTNDYYYSATAPERAFTIIKGNDLPNLTQREIQFLFLNCSNLSYSEIADRMYVSIRTIQDYHGTLCKKFHLTTRMDLALFAIQVGLVSINKTLTNVKL